MSAHGEGNDVRLIYVTWASLHTVGVATDLQVRPQTAGYRRAKTARIYVPEDYSAARFGTNFAAS